MFKKTFLVLLALSPLIFNVVIGIPILSESDYLAKKEISNFSQTSRRCFWVANYEEYVHCLKNNPKLSGAKLIETVLEKTNRLSPVFTALLIISITVNVVLIVYLLIKLK